MTRGLAAKITQKSDSPTAGGPDLDGRAVRRRLVQVIVERAQRDGRAVGDVKRALARAVSSTGLKWDTVSKKLRGERRMDEDSLRRIAVAFGENPEWLATGEGPHGDRWIRQRFEKVALRRGQPLPSAPDRSMGTDSRCTGRRGRPRKVAQLGPRVTGESTGAKKRRRPRGREYHAFPENATERARCMDWLARNPDILNEWIGKELDGERRQAVLASLLAAAQRSVHVAADKDAAAARQPLVEEASNALADAENAANLR